MRRSHLALFLAVLVAAPAVAQSPIVTLGGDLAFREQAANLCLLGPVSGSSARPTFRLLQLGDLPGTTTAGQLLRSQGTARAPAYTTATWPATTTVNQLLYSSASNTVGGLATAASSVLKTNGDGVPTWTTSFALAGSIGSDTSLDSPAHVVPGTGGGGNQTDTVDGETVTISVAGATTDTAEEILHANSEIGWITYRVQEALEGVHAVGTMTLTGVPSASVAAVGTMSFTGAPHQAIRAAGTLTFTGVPHGVIAAAGTITMSGVATADETFQVGAQEFTWKASRGGVGEVTIGASAAAAAANIVTAITADLATVTASALGSTVLVTAVTPGAAGNAIAFTEASTNMTVDGSDTLGGWISGADADTFTIDDQEFTWVASRAVLGEVTIGGTAAACVTNAIAAITADLATVTASDGAGDTVVVSAATAGTAGNAIVFTESSSVTSVDGAGTLGTTVAGAAADSFVVGAQTFTWVTNRAVAGEVTVGVDAPAAVTNAVTAINLDLATVDAADGDGDTVVVTAAAAGTAGNSLTFTESASTTSMDGAGVLGGTVSGAAADTFAVDDQTFTWVTARGGTGEVTVGGTAAACVTNIVAAVSTDLATVTPADGDGDTVVITAVAPGTAGNAIVFTEDSGNLTIDGAGTLGATVAGAEVTGFTIGDGTNAARFCGTQSTVTAGATGYCYAHRLPTVASQGLSPIQPSAAALRITTAGATPTAGSIKIVVYQRTWAAPSS